MKLIIGGERMFVESVSLCTNYATNIDLGRIEPGLQKLPRLSLGIKLGCTQPGCIAEGLVAPLRERLAKSGLCVCAYSPMVQEQPGSHLTFV